MGLFSSKGSEKSGAASKFGRAERKALNNTGRQQAGLKAKAGKEQKAPKRGW